MAWNHIYDVNTPAGSDDPKEGDDRIREVKAALQERLAQDHYFPKTGSQVSDTAAGEHKKVTLRVGSAPSAVANKGIVYAKDVDSKAELFYIDEDGDEVQLTAGGSIVGPKVHSSVGADTASTNSTSYVDIADMSITATFPAGKVLIGLSINLTGSAALNAICAIVVDGNLKKAGFERLPGADDRHSMNLSWVETLTAGEHTIKIQWKVNTNTLYNYGADYKRVLTVLECK